MKDIFIRGDDFKAKAWKENYGSKDFKINTIGGSRIFFTLKVIRKTIFSRDNRVYVVFRYLNDYESFLKSLMLLLMELILIVYSKLKGYNILWICHNLDKETQNYYPRLVRIRREIILKASERIYVTDELLVKYAKIIFSKAKHKIRYISFGKYEPSLLLEYTSNKFQEKKEIEEKENKFYKNISFEKLLTTANLVRSNFKYVGFCAGKYSSKKIYYDLLPGLIKKSKYLGCNLAFIVITDLERNESPELFDFLKKSKEILFINNLMNLDEYKLSQYFDFYWLAYNDISVPYTVYTAASVKKPILTFDAGILPILVTHYKLGYFLKKDYSNLMELLQLSKSNKALFYSDFLKNKTWKKGIENMIAKNYND